METVQDSSGFIYSLLFEFRSSELSPRNCFTILERIQMGPGGGLTCAARITSVPKQQAVIILAESRFIRQWQQKFFELLKSSFYDNAFLKSGIVERNGCMLFNLKPM